MRRYSGDMRSDSCNGARRYGRPSCEFDNFSAILVVRNCRLRRSSSSCAERDRPSPSDALWSNLISVCTLQYRNVPLTDLPLNQICLEYQGMNLDWTGILSCTKYASQRSKSFLRCWRSSLSIRSLKWGSGDETWSCGYRLRFDFALGLPPFALTYGNSSIMSASA